MRLIQYLFCEDSEHPVLPLPLSAIPETTENKEPRQILVCRSCNSLDGEYVFLVNYSRKLLPVQYIIADPAYIFQVTPVTCRLFS